MGRILAIDYGKKRTGVAVTDMLHISANPLDTVATNEIWIFLREYLSKEKVERFVVGEPKNLDNNDSEMSAPVRNFVKKLETNYPDIPISMVDERFTSKIAQMTMIQGGMKKKDRQNKANVDKISAVIILQSYLELQSNNSFRLP